MKRTFVQTKFFSETLDQLINQGKLLWDDYIDLENRLLNDQDEGDVITGTGGLRKTRLKSQLKVRAEGLEFVI